MKVECLPSDSFKIAWKLSTPSLFSIFDITKGLMKVFDESSLLSSATHLFKYAMTDLTLSGVRINDAEEEIQIRNLKIDRYKWYELNCKVPGEDKRSTESWILKWKKSLYLQQLLF